MTQRHRQHHVSFLARLFGFQKLVEDLDQARFERDTAKSSLESARRELKTTLGRNQELENRTIELTNRASAVWIRPENRIPESEIRRSFVVPNDSPLWRALHQELDDSITDLIDTTSAEPRDSSSELKRLHAAGGVDALRAFQRRLIERQHLAEVEDRELSEKEDA